MKPYALYRLPYADECIRIEKHTGSALLKTNDGKLPEVFRGFVMVPFDTRRETVMIDGEQQTQKIPLQDCNTLLTSPSANSNDPLDCIFNRQGSATTYNYPCFKNALDQGLFDKLVLSRSLTIPAHIDPEKAFYQACRLYPRMMIYLCHVPEIGTWLGCTPEILLSGCKTHYRTVALAGTMPFAHQVEWTEKNKREQAIVAHYIKEILQRHADVIEEEGPYTSRAGQLVHLKTEFHFQPRQGTSIANIIDELHPTPAVCGVPKEQARHFIIQNEGYDRKYYSGIVGMYDPMGETNLFVNLRCAEILPNTATLYAGGGILTDSTQESEWKETEEKMKTIGRVLF